MEHQHAPAQAVGAHLEAGAIGGEWIAARTGHGAPASSGVGFVRIVLAVVEDDLEHPVVASGGSRRIGRARRLGISSGVAVAVADALEVAVGRAAIDACAAVALVGLREVDAG